MNAQHWWCMMVWEPFFLMLGPKLIPSSIIQCCRCCHIFPWVWACCTWVIEQNKILWLPWAKVCVSSGICFILLIIGCLCSGVVVDFVEAPSQMLENWFWEPKVLRKITSHYKTEEALPDDLIEKLIKRFVPFSQSSSGYWVYWILPQQSRCQQGTMVPFRPFLCKVWLGGSQHPR